MTERSSPTRCPTTRTRVLAVLAFLLLPIADVAADPSSENGDPPQAPQVPAEEDNRSFRSGPPDTTPYARPTVPEDYAPMGEPAIPPGVTVPPPNESQDTEKTGSTDLEAIEKKN